MANRNIFSLKGGVFIIVLSIIFHSILLSQDLAYAHKIVESLASPAMHGRGFVKNGNRKAAGYIQQQFIHNRVIPFSKNFSQPFTLDVNTFPYNIKLTINNRKLIPGVEFIVDPSSPALHGTFGVYCLTSRQFIENPINETLKLAAGKILLIDNRLEEKLTNVGKIDFPMRVLHIQQNKSSGIKGIIEFSEKKPSWGASTEMLYVPLFKVKSDIIPDSIKTISLNLKNRFRKNCKTSNIAGFIPGTLSPDSFILFTAHYDHLGMMGKKIYFPGANDNASGIAMLLYLEKYFQVHPQKYSIVFIAFSAEEEGLWGSSFFVAHPLVNLEKIKFLINCDLVGTGDKGITVVNAPEFPKYYQFLITLNDSLKLLPEIKKGAQAATAISVRFLQKEFLVFLSTPWEG